MSTFSFDNDTPAEIKNSEGGIIVSVVDTIEILRSPTKKEAETFVMFGDVENSKGNDFINITKPSFNLKWKCG